MKQLFILITLLISININANDTELTTLEKQNLLEWTNEHCNENHLTYESLSKDRYFNCEYNWRNYPGGLQGSVISGRKNPWGKAFFTYLIIFVFCSVIGTVTYLFLGMREKDILYGNHKDKDSLLKQFKESKKFIIYSTIIALILGIVFLSYIALKKSLIEMVRNSELTYIKIVLPIVSAMTNDKKIIMLAISNGRIEVIKYLVDEKKYNPNIYIKSKYSDENETPLGLALRNKSYDIIDYLKQQLPAGEPLDIKLASRSFDIDLLKKSVKLGNPTSKEILDGFLISIKYFDFKAMKYLYELNPSMINRIEDRVDNPYVIYLSNRLPLRVAIDNDNFKAVQFLVSKNAKINDNDIIAYVVHIDNIKIFKYLLENGAIIKLNDSKWMFRNIYKKIAWLRENKVSEIEKLVIKKGWISSEKLKQIKKDVNNGRSSKYE